MTILVVDNDPDRLWELVSNVRSVFSDCVVEYTHDPLMAGKFGLSRHVDILLSETVMKRMNGFELATFLRRRNPEMKVFLISGQDESVDSIILDNSGIDGQLIRPVTTSALAKIEISCCSVFTD